MSQIHNESIQILTYALHQFGSTSPSFLHRHLHGKYKSCGSNAVPHAMSKMDGQTVPNMQISGYKKKHSLTPLSSCRPLMTRHTCRDSGKFSDAGMFLSSHYELLGRYRKYIQKYKVSWSPLCWISNPPDPPTAPSISSHQISSQWVTWCDMLSIIFFLE